MEGDSDHHHCTPKCSGVVVLGWHPPSPLVNVSRVSAKMYHFRECIFGRGGGVVVLGILSGLARPGPARPTPTGHGPWWVGWGWGCLVVLGTLAGDPGILTSNISRIRGSICLGIHAGDVWRLAIPDLRVPSAMQDFRGKHGNDHRLITGTVRRGNLGGTNTGVSSTWNPAKLSRPFRIPTGATPEC